MILSDEMKKKIGGLSLAELRELARQAGKEDIYLNLLSSGNFEEVSISLGMENEFNEYLTRLNETNIDDFQNRTDQMILFRMYLLSKICFPEA